MGRSVAAASGRTDGSNAAGFTGVADAPDWVLQLSQLALYFCLWTEAANLRHTPELLWLLYHMLLSSNNFNKVGCQQPFVLGRGVGLCECVLQEGGNT